MYFVRLLLLDRGFGGTAHTVRLVLGFWVQKMHQSDNASFISSELLSMPAVKRFSVSYARHPTNGMNVVWSLCV